MYAVDTGAEPALLHEALRSLQLVGMALAVGWPAARLLDPGISARGLPFLCGIAGLHAGSWLWNAAGWGGGPAVAGHPLAPAFAGALAVAGLLKLIGLGVAGPRR